MSLIHFYYDPITAGFDRLLEDALTSQTCPGACASSTPGGHTGPRRSDAYRPRLDLHESKDTDSVTATFELPGFTREGVTIDIHQNRLTVSGESLISSDAQEEGRYVVRERCSGKFSRTLKLPFGTKPEDVTAKMENGVLTITFPKTSPEQQPTRITVQ